MKKRLTILGILAAIAAGAIDDLGMTAALTLAGSNNFEYRELDAKHFIWGIVYRDENNFDWLFSRRKQE